MSWRNANDKKERRRNVLAKTGGFCAYCGDQLDVTNFEIDHVIPRVSGGTSHLSNLAPACSVCNGLKKSRSVAQFSDLFSFARSPLYRIVSYPQAQRLAQLGLVKAWDIVPFSFPEVLQVPLPASCYRFPGHPLRRDRVA